MPRRPTQPPKAEPAAEDVRVPSGAPSWVTPELLAHTLRVWQPFYANPLTPEDALAMIQAAGGLIEVLSTETSHETVRGPRASQQSRART